MTARLAGDAGALGGTRAAVRVVGDDRHARVVEQRRLRCEQTQGPRRRSCSSVRAPRITDMTASRGRSSEKKGCPYVVIQDDGQHSVQCETQDSTHHIATLTPG